MPPKGGGLGGFGNASGGTKAGGGFSTHTAHEKKHQEAKSEAMRVTNDELKHVEATAKVLAEVEKTRAPPYQKKIDLRKKLWQTMLGILEAGQVENQQLTAAMKEKIKAEKDYATMLKDVGKDAKPIKKGDPAMSVLDEVMNDQVAIADSLLANVTFMEEQIVGKLNDASAAYVAEVGAIQKTGIDLLHLFDVADTQVKTAFEHFKSISNLKAIKEQHFKEQAKRANDDSITSGLSEHDLWFGEVKYRVAVIFCQSSFEKYDEGFQEIIDNVRTIEIDRRVEVNRIMFELIRKQEEIRFKVPDAAANDTLKAGVHTPAPLTEKEAQLLKDQDLVIKTKGLEEIDVVLGEIIPYPDLKLGSPLESKLLTVFWPGQYKPPGVSLSGFQRAIILRTIDDHIHIFNVPKGTEKEMDPEDIFSSLVPPPHVPKVHKAKKKSTTDTLQAPKKSSAEKDFKAVDMLIKPDFTIALEACDSFKAGNKAGDVVVTQRIKKKGMMGGEDKSKFIFHGLADTPEMAQILGDGVFETEKEWKAARKA